MKNLFIAGSLAAVLLAPAFALAAPVVVAPTTVISTAGTGASVSPLGTTIVANGDTQIFTVGASQGFTLSSVVFDGINQPLGDVSVTGLAIDPIAHTLDVGATANPPQGGGAMPWCSNPMAPGWNTSLPDGGCGGAFNFVAFGQPIFIGNAGGIGLATTCVFKQGCMLPR